jgi:GT2 family glycosyltransferase
MNVSVVVPAYNRNDVLMMCVNSLLVQKVRDSSFEVIVVDDCSKELCSEVLEDLLGSNKNLSVVRHSNNKGLAAARNTGARSSRNQILIFLDSDIVPEPDFIQSHLDLHRSYPDEAIAVISNLSYPDEVVQKSNFARYMNGRYLGNRAGLLKKLLNYDDLPAKNFGGGICSLRRTTFFEVGCFDEKFIKYGGEDEEMGCRLRLANVSIKFCPNAKAIHHDNVTIKRSRDKTTEWVLNALPLLDTKHPQYFLSTSIKYVRRKPGSVSSLQLVVYSIAKCVLNRFTMVALENVLEALDGVKLFYFPPLYRALSLAWLLNGQKVRSQKTYSSVWK